MIRLIITEPRKSAAHAIIRRLGAGMHEQPVPHPYFHRSLTSLIAPIIESGFVLDGLEERRAFPAGYATGNTVVSMSKGRCA